MSFSKFSEFSDVWFNLSLHELNLSHVKTLHKPTQSQIDARWDLMSHQSEILHSLIKEKTSFVPETLCLSVA